MVNILKCLYRGLLRKLPDVPAIYIIYFRGYRKLLNLRNPQYFGEKIQWLKLYGHLDELAAYVDKYEVRNYVERTIGGQYLNKLYGVYNSVDEVDFSLLPKRFVLKCTNGSGAVLICKDKDKVNISSAKKEMAQWLNDKFYLMKKEPQYKNVKNRIIAERYLEDDSGALRDYKFYCYDGEPYYYGVFTNRFANETVDMYDMTGKKLEGVRNGGVKNSNYIVKQGENFPELINLVKELAKPFQFVRVDFYMANGDIYFGELTFTDGAGAEGFTPRSFDLEMAKRIKLCNTLKKDVQF